MPVALELILGPHTKRRNTSRREVYESVYEITGLDSVDKFKVALNKYDNGEYNQHRNCMGCVCMDEAMLLALLYITLTAL